MDRWNGNVAVVTGASSGIGETVARHLVKSGLNVIGLARRQEKLDEIAKNTHGSKGKFYALKVDITREDEIVSAFKWITDNVGIVHVLVNNAGIIRNTNLMNGNTQQWKEVLDTNVFGLCIATREAIRIMRVNRVDGHIIHMNSISGHYVPYVPNVHLNIYLAAKHGVTALTETLRQELHSFGNKIKVTSISPGFVNTEIVKALGRSAEVLETMESLPRLMPEDIANAVLYVLGTPPHVQVHELIIRPVGEPF